MNLKTIVQIFIIILIITILFSFINIFFKENTIEQVYINEEKITDTQLTKRNTSEDITNSALREVIENLEYNSIDQSGNKYLINAKLGEINLENKNIMLLNEVSGKIILVKKSPIYIYSNYAEYNTTNFDTKFYDQVIVKFEKNQITSNNLDLFFKDNHAYMYNNIYFFNDFSDLKADKITFNLLNGNVNVNMFDNSNKIKILKK